MSSGKFNSTQIKVRQHNQAAGLHNAPLVPTSVAHSSEFLPGLSGWHYSIAGEPSQFIQINQLFQILSIDLGTELLPGISMSKEPPEGEVMHRPPRPKDQVLASPTLLAYAYLYIGLWG